jgi:hypothetical protein
MSRYKAYPEYKDSGEEWLGKVPSHWDVVQIKYLSQVKRGASPSRLMIKNTLMMMVNTLGLESLM